MPPAARDAIDGFDHVMICVRDLDAARQAWDRLGFVTAPLGNHTTKATANHCIMFADTYLELIGINEPEKPDLSGVTQRLAAAGEGLHRLALATPDADAAKALLEAAGLHPIGPVDLARPQDDPPGMVRFRNLDIPADETAGIQMFLCGHKTPELMRTPLLMAHPSGAVGFAGLTVMVTDSLAAGAALEKVFGAGSSSPALYGAVVETGRGRIHLADAGGFALAHPGAVPPDTGLPRVHALTIAVRSLAATAASLDASGVDYVRLIDRLRVSPADATGVLLEFIAG